MKVNPIVLQGDKMTAWEEYCDLYESDQNALYYGHPDYLKMLEMVTGGNIVIHSLGYHGQMMAALPAIVMYGEHGPVMNSLPFFGGNPGIIIRNGDLSILSIMKHGQPLSLSLRNELSRMIWNTSDNYAAVTIIDHPFGVHSSIRSNDQVKRMYISERIGMYTQINDPGNLMNSFHPKTRNMIRKAERENVQVIRSNMSWVIDRIREVHRENMEAIGAPIKPDSFFSWVLRNPPGLQVYVAMCQGKFAAGLIAFRNKKTTEYFMPVVKDDFRHVAPLNLLIYEAMKIEAFEGVWFWNWGGTTMPGMEGVYRFKKRFAGRESVYQYHTQVNNRLLLDKTPEYLKEKYPYFFVVPFDKLKMEEEKEEDGQSGN